jgi:hypothetical protein
MSFLLCLHTDAQAVLRNTLRVGRIPSRYRRNLGHLDRNCPAIIGVRRSAVSGTFWTQL